MKASSSNHKKISQGCFGISCFILMLVIFQRPVIKWFSESLIRSALKDQLNLNYKDGQILGDASGTFQLTSWALDSENPKTPLQSLSIKKLRLAFSWNKFLRSSLIPVSKIQGEGIDVTLDLSKDWGSSTESSSNDLIIDSIPDVDIKNSNLTITRGQDVWQFRGMHFKTENGEYHLKVNQAYGLKASFLADFSGLPIELKGKFNLSERGFESLFLEMLELGPDSLLSNVKVQSDSKALAIDGTLPFLPGKGRFNRNSKSTEFHLNMEEVELEHIIHQVIGQFFQLPILTGKFNLDLSVDLPQDENKVAMRHPVSLDSDLTNLAWPEHQLHSPKIQIEWLPSNRGASGKFLIEGLTSSGMAAIDLNIEFESIEDPLNPRIQFKKIQITSTDETWFASGIYYTKTNELDLNARLVLSDLNCTQLNFISPWLGERNERSLASASAELLLNYRGPLNFSFNLDEIYNPILDDGRLDLELFLNSPDQDTQLYSQATLHQRELTLNRVHLKRNQDWVELNGKLTTENFQSWLVTFLVEGKWNGQEIRSSHPLTLGYKDAAFYLEPFILEAFGGSLDVTSSQLPTHSEFHFTGTNLDLQQLTTLFPLPFELGGKLDFSGNLSSNALASSADNASDKTEWKGEASLKVKEGSFKNERVDLDNLTSEIDFQFDDGLIDVQKLSAIRGPDSIHGSGKLAFPSPPSEDSNPSSTELKYQFKLQGNLEYLQSWFPNLSEIRRIGGGLSFDVDLNGTPSEPVLGGTLNLKDLRASLPRNQGELTEIAGQIQVDQNQIRILDTLSAKFKGEPIQLKGDLTHASKLFGSPKGSSQGDERHSLSESPIPIKVVNLSVDTGVLNLIPASLANEFRAYGAVHLTLVGPPNELEVRGKVDLRRAFLFKRMQLLAERNPLPLEYFSFDEAPLKGLKFDVAIRCDNNFHVKNNLLNLSADVDLHLKGTGESPYFVGRIFSDNGSVRLPSTTSLKVDQLLVELLEKEPYNPHLQIKLINRLRGYDVDVFVHGDFERPEVTLNSFPPLEREKLLILVTTGYTLDDINRTGAEKVAVLQAAKYLGFLLADYFSEAGEGKSFLDDFTLETEGARKIQGEDLIRLEYRLNDHFFLQGERDFYEDYNLNLGYRLQFK